jgi:uncharacterized protein (DUF1778 family)
MIDCLDMYVNVMYTSLEAREASRRRHMIRATARRYERFGARIRPEQKAVLQRAADIAGRSLSDFVIAAAEREAEETIRRHEIIQLTARDSHQLAEALLNPLSPSERLRAAFEDYEAFIGERA